MYKLNKEFVRNRIAEISEDNKSYERHTFPYKEAAGPIARAPGVDLDIVFRIIGNGEYIKDEEFVLSVTEALMLK